jgi:hemolysin TlyA family protein
VARKGVRLDALLVERGLFPTRAKAKAAIMAGVVYVDGQRAGKAGSAVSPDAQLEVRGPANPYVSRGGLKLEHALDRFGVLVAGRTCIDVGASTGGFTDCLLQRGAARVYAVDVGYGQLDWKLRQDPRVVVVERTNFRHVQPGDLPRADLIVIDVSFISLIKILPAAQGTLKDDGDVVALIKPQFEAGRRAVGKGGVVRDAGVHREVIQNLLAGAGALGWRPIALTYSPVLGPKGNIEFFVWWKRNPQGETTSSVDAETVSQVVAQAHEALL